MNLSYKWLCELVDIDLSPEELGEKLTAIGCAVEEIEQIGDDYMLVAEVTTNRPDWLCHLGVAHEIAAVTGKALKRPEIRLNETGPDVNSLTSVEMKDPEYCPRYVARLIQGVTVKESPEWLKLRLVAIGQRPINNIVDITNLVCFEMNQPLHAFDFDLLEDNRIVVRRSEDGEIFKAITGEESVLTGKMLSIADGRKTVALAGVKGGTDSEVHEGTINILLEAAYFQPQQVRRSSRATKMSSESSYRFERGIDPGGVERASARAAQLILELAGGTLAKGAIDTNPDLGAPCEVTIRLARCAKLLGVSIPKEEILQIFSGLGLEIISDKDETITVRVPSFRRDITRETDLIEEVIRVAGYDLVPTDLTMGLQISHEPELISARRAATKVLEGLGYFECWTDSFVPEAYNLRYGTSDSAVAYPIQNPVNAERPMLRLSLISSLLEVRRVNRLAHDVRLYEINHTYELRGNERIEPTRLTILDDRGVRYAYGAFTELLEALWIRTKLTVRPADTCPGFAPGNGAGVYLDDKLVAMMGVISDEQQKLYGLDLAPALLEADLGIIAALPRQTRVYEQLPRFPAIRRDIALLVPENICWHEIEKLVREKADLLETISFESIFRGKGVEEGMKSVAFSMSFRATERSLTDEEANLQRDQIVSHLSATISGATTRPA